MKASINDILNGIKPIIIQQTIQCALHIRKGALSNDATCKYILRIRKTLYMVTFFQAQI